MERELRNDSNAPQVVTWLAQLVLAMILNALHDMGQVTYRPSYPHYIGPSHLVRWRRYVTVH